MHGDDEVKYHDDLDGQDVGGHPPDNDPGHTFTCSNVDVQRTGMDSGDSEKTSSGPARILQGQSLPSSEGPYSAQASCRARQARGGPQRPPSVKDSGRPTGLSQIGQWHVLKGQDGQGNQGG
jgi:hypothetical protein